MIFVLLKTEDGDTRNIYLVDTMLCGTVGEVLFVCLIIYACNQIYYVLEFGFPALWATTLKNINISPTR